MQGRCETHRHKKRPSQAGRSGQNKKYRIPKGTFGCVFADRTNVSLPLGSMFCNQLATKADNVSETNFAKDYFQERY